MGALVGRAEVQDFRVGLPSRGSPRDGDVLCGAAVVLHLYLLGRRVGRPGDDVLLSIPTGLGAAVRSGEIDLVARILTATTTRDARWGNFAHTMYYPEHLAPNLESAKLMVRPMLETGIANERSSAPP